MSILLIAAKITVMPMLVYGISWAQQRWGRVIAGLLGGLPLMAAPISLFLAIEQGLPFAREAAFFSLLGVMLLSAYIFTYVISARYLRWWGALPLSWSVWLLVAIQVTGSDVAHVWMVVVGFLAWVTNIVFIHSFPYTATPPMKPPRFDLVLRAGTAMVMILTVTGFAHILGETWSGAFMVFPVVWSVMIPFNHAQYGRGAVIEFFRGAVIGNVSLLIFAGAVVALPSQMGIAALYVVAVAASVVAAYGVKRLLSNWI
ncbi:MAG: hypothetical protein P8Y67_02395 [Alphaproteobacteria bacterium]